MHNETTDLISVNARVRGKSEFERLELVSSMRRVAEDAARQWVSAKAASYGSADLGRGPPRRTCPRWPPSMQVLQPVLNVLQQTLDVALLVFQPARNFVQQLREFCCLAVAAFGGTRARCALRAA